MEYKDYQGEIPSDIEDGTLVSIERNTPLREVVTPMVILLFCDPAVDVFLLHVVPVIQVLPECSSGLSY